MEAFEKYWKPTEEYCNTTTEYERQRNTWTAALLHAAEIVDDLNVVGSTDLQAHHAAKLKNEIAAAIRKEAGE